LTSSNESSEVEKAALIAELKQREIKHTPENIICIAKTSDGKIVFLEVGNLGSGLQHILRNHILQFADQGIPQNQIPDAIITALTQGQIVGYQGKAHQTPRPIYEFVFNGETKYLAVQVANNGYIVSANPSGQLSF